MSSNRFSIVILEKDVLEYHNYKLKYNKYYDLFMNANYENKESLRIKRDYWYNKYINKMQYLEKNYRKTNIYTDYHRELEDVTIQQTIRQRQRRHTIQHNPIHIDTLPSAPLLPDIDNTHIPIAVPVSPERLRTYSPITLPPINIHK